MEWLWWLLVIPVALVLFLILQVVYLVIVMKRVVDFFQFNPMTWLSFETISEQTGTQHNMLASLLEVMADESIVESRVDTDAIAKRGKSTEAMKQVRVNRFNARLFEYRFVRRGRRRPRFSELLKSRLGGLLPEPAGKTV